MFGAVFKCAKCKALHSRQCSLWSNCRSTRQRYARCSLRSFASPRTAAQFSSSAPNSRSDTIALVSGLRLPKDWTIQAFGKLTWLTDWRVTCQYPWSYRGMALVSIERNNIAWWNGRRREWLNGTVYSTKPIMIITISLMILSSKTHGKFAPMFSILLLPWIISFDCLGSLY